MVSLTIALGQGEEEMTLDLICFNFWETWKVDRFTPERHRDYSLGHKEKESTSGSNSCSKSVNC